MKRWLGGIAAALLVLVACDTGTTDPDDRSIGRTPRQRPGRPAEAPLKIGLIGTMTGPEGWRGEDAFEGADLGVHHLNRRIGENQKRFELEVLDDGGDGARSLELLDNLLGRGDTAGIVFAGPPEAIAEAEAILRRARTAAILCYGDLYGARQLTPESHIFQATPPYAWQARDVARYVSRDRGYARVGVLTEEGTLDGSVSARASLEALEDYGVGRVVRATYQGDVETALRGLRDKQVEAVVVQGPPSALERIFAGIERMGARYRNSRAARIWSLNKKSLRRRRQRSGWWHPQVIGYDLMINDRTRPPPPGTMATSTYARGAHFLPLPSLQRFRRSFEDWWDSSPTGQELRAFEATMAIGWAAQRAGDDGDVARSLEDLRQQRFGGLPVTLGPDDHVLVEEVTIGLWTVPFPSDRTNVNAPETLPWVPLARGFSIDGETTDVLTGDWKWLFRNPPPRGGPAPRFARMRFGVTTPRSDPLR